MKLTRTSPSWWPTLFLAIFLLGMTPSAFAQAAAPSIGQMFANFSGASTALIHFVHALAYVIGTATVISGLVKFKDYASGSQTMKISTPITWVVVGVFIICLSWTADVGAATLSVSGAVGNALSIGGASGGANTAAIIKGIFLFFALIGNIALFRGLVILKMVPAGQGQATVGKAATYMIAGILAMHLDKFVIILASTLAPGVPLPFN